MEQLQFVISFPEEPVARANDFTAELREVVLDSHPDARAERRKDDPSTQDFGATLAVILGTPAVIVVAKGIQAWLRAHHGVKLHIKRCDGTIVAENLTGDQAIELAELMLAGNAGPSTTC